MLTHFFDSHGFGGGEKEQILKLDGEGVQVKAEDIESPHVISTADCVVIFTCAPVSLCCLVR